MIKRWYPQLNSRHGFRGWTADWGRNGEETGEHSGIEYTTLEEVPLDSELERYFAEIFSTEMLRGQNPQEGYIKVL